MTVRLAAVAASQQDPCQIGRSRDLRGLGIVDSLPGQSFAEILYRHHEQQESGRKISQATGMHRQSLKKILVTADAAHRT